MSTRTTTLSHRRPHTREYYTQLITLTQVKQIINRTLTSGKLDGSVVLEKRNVLRLDLKECREGFFRKGKGRSFHVEGSKTKEKENRSTSNLETESIRSRTDSTRGCAFLPGGKFR